MVARRKVARHFAAETVAVLLLAVAGAFLAAGCGKVTSSPVAPAAIDTGVADVRVEPAAKVVAPGGELTVIVSVTDKNGGPVKDGTVVTLLNDALGVVIPTTATTIDGQVKVKFRAGTTQGTSEIKANAGGATHVTTVKIQAGAPPPAPPPTPPPANSEDEIPISSVIWEDASPASFKVTAKLSNIHINGLTITWNFTQPGWTEEDGNKGGVVGNMWVFAKLGGRWHAATFEWLRRTTQRSALEAKPGQPPFVQAHGSLTTWRPAPGEKIGFMASTMCRAGIPARSVRQRSPIRLTTWP